MMVCVISKESYGDLYAREIRTNVEYIEEQYLDFAIVPPELVDGIVATKGYCDLELSEDGKTVVSFTAKEIPVLPPSPQDYEARILALEEELAAAKILLGVD